MATSAQSDIELASIHADQGLPKHNDSVGPAPSVPARINRTDFLSLLGQHASSSWSARTCEFAFYLFLIQLFPNTLLPTAIYGFCTTGVSVLFSGSVGGLVDRFPRLRLVQTFIGIQKLCILASCSVFLGLLLHIGDIGDYRNAAAGVWAAFAGIVALGCILSLANVGISVAIERDWVTAIAQQCGDDSLTRLNTWIRRIDLLSKLLAPLLTSLFTATISYPFAVAATMVVAGVTLIFELWWIRIVHSRFSILAETDKTTDRTSALVEKVTTRSQCSTARFMSAYRDWRQFAAMPIFPSVVAVSLLYFTVLSFDGTMLAYLKSRNYNDAFLAGQRGICVVTGLMGTILMPYLERKIGLIRAGAWSITSELLCLVPVLATFYSKMPPTSMGPAWGEVLLFGGMAASRIGLWSFDLCQLKEMQLALAEHPRRNRFMGLQYSLQSLADLGKYVLVIVLAQPSQFQWAALVSFIAVFAGVISYTAYIKIERGHILHTVRIPLLRKGR